MSKTLKCIVIQTGILIALLGGTGCKEKPVTVTAKAETAGLYPHGPLWGALWQQRAAEYKALCFQAYYTATLSLNELLKQPSKMPRAIVTDIDETVLDNSPYYVHQALNGEMYSDASWMEWTARVACDTVPGALSFLKYAASKGVKVFYITNRLEAERKITLENLQKWGFPDADDAHLTLKQTTSSKDERRNLVAAGHNIIMLLGDNLGDFATAFDKQTYENRDSLVVNGATQFGTRFIVLPNPMYGDWEEVLFKYGKDLSVAEKNEQLKKWVKNY
ncbi:5'-nucleotidase, lipoprotein e(P4) family [Chitinophaga defluvii]|uniref:5'-nucleotidase, lipoprotein e(P4) family n=1 Tax=Chitinophaga defluvii TaxID=3163343 RepID=A0ABV2T5V4_9BACT